MQDKHTHIHIVSSLFKMLCWREEKKRWLTIYEELLSEISFAPTIKEDQKAVLLLKIVPLKYMDFKRFRQKVFEVINYVENIEA